MAVLGCIADDFTGAGDAASFLAKGGMSVRLFCGIPRDTLQAEGDCGEENGAQAIVIALKSRTGEREWAVAESLKAARFLLEQGAEQIYFKYCSTFDSTPGGNIGPVADALMDFLGTPYTLLCPALPANGRTVEGGRLLVNGVPLHESHMRSHPLTPMWDCRIDRLMKPQSRYGCRILQAGEWDGFCADDSECQPFYLIPDQRSQEDGEQIAAAFFHLPLLTGASGLLEPLARLWAEKRGFGETVFKSGTRGPALLVAGSCSQATLEQIAWYKAQGKPCYKLDPAAMAAGRQTTEDAWRFADAWGRAGEAPLVYSSDSPEQVAKYQELGRERIARMLEEAAAQLAGRAVEAGYTRIICAGGETSGAVAGALGFSSYRIGESAAPGVPVMAPVERPDIRIILKSGNFGGSDFFGRALDITGK